MNTEPKVIWPDIFITPDMDYYTDRPELERRGAAIADQLLGWANCTLEKPPKGFGMGMANLAKITGTATQDKLVELSDQWVEEWDAQEGKK